MEFRSAFSGCAVLAEKVCTPHGVAASLSGSGFIVADFGNNRLKCFSSAGAFLGLFGNCNFGSVPWQFPYRIAVDIRRRLYVVLEKGFALFPGRVELMDERGTLLTVLPFQLVNPAGVTVDTQGRIIVLDLASPKTLYVLNSDGSFITTTFNVHVDNPVGLVAIKNEVFICDAADDKMKVFSYDGTFIRMFALESESPFAVRLNSSSKIVVGSHLPGTINGTLNVYELDGELLADHDFSMNQGQCLDMDCFGENCVWVSTSFGLVYSYNYSLNLIPSPRVDDASFEQDTPPSSS